jgi:predicted ATPase
VAIGSFSFDVVHWVDINRLRCRIAKQQRVAGLTVVDFIGDRESGLVKVIGSICLFYDDYSVL